MILGLDIGGTKIRAGLVDPSGRIAGDPVSVPTGAHDSADDILAQIASLARHGDSMAMKIFDEFASSLAFALAWTVNMTDPDAVVLGGSVIDSSDLFLDKADALFRRYVCPEPARNVKLGLSALGADAGVIGAAALLA